MDFSAGDNNDSITVIDVTEPKKVHCCFVSFQDKLEQDQRSQNGNESEEDEEIERHDVGRRIIKGMTPLPASSYLLGILRQRRREDPGEFSRLSRMPRVFSTRGCCCVEGYLAS